MFPVCFGGRTRDGRSHRGVSVGSRALSHPATDKSHHPPHPRFKKKEDACPAVSGRRGPSPAGTVTSAGSASTVTMPGPVCPGSEAWKMPKDSPSSQQGLDAAVDGEGRACRAPGDPPRPPSPEGLGLRLPGPYSPGFLLPPHGTPLPGPPAWPHVPHTGALGCIPPGAERPMGAVPADKCTYSRFPSVRPTPVPSARNPGQVSRATGAQAVPGRPCPADSRALGAWPGAVCVPPRRQQTHGAGQAWGVGAGVPPGDAEEPAGRGGASEGLSGAGGGRASWESAARAAQQGRARRPASAQGPCSPSARAPASSTTCGRRASPRRGARSPAASSWGRAAWGSGSPGTSRSSTRRYRRARP